MIPSERPITFSICYYWYESAHKCIQCTCQTGTRHGSIGNTCTNYKSHSSALMMEERNPQQLILPSMPSSQYPINMHMHMHMHMRQAGLGFPIIIHKGTCTCTCTWTCTWTCGRLVRSWVRLSPQLYNKLCKSIMWQANQVMACPILQQANRDMEKFNCSK